MGTNVEEMELVSCAADAVREEQDIALQPRSFLHGILEAYAWATHVCGGLLLSFFFF